MRKKIRKIPSLGKKSSKAHHDENMKESRKDYWKCGKMVARSLKKHLNIDNSEETEASEVSENLPYKCPICRETYENITLFFTDLYDHLAFHVAENSDKWESNMCKVCGETYEVAEQLTNHLLSHINSLKLIGFDGAVKKKRGNVEKACKPTCEICGKTISRKYAMKRHLATHSGEKKFTCHHCGKQYAQESGLQRHMRVIHKGIRKYKCPICSEVFGSNSDLKSHQDTHTDPRPFQCDKCGRTFISQKHLHHHRKYHHTTNGMRQLCKICNQFFSSPSVLRRHHKVIHLGLKEYQCHVCSAKLSTKHYLQEHIILHSKDRPFVCGVCGKTFQVANYLRQHMKTHMRKTHICHACGKGFTRRCHLVIHMRSHKGLEKPQCEHCNKTFLLKGDLEKHIKREHTKKVGD